METFREFTWIPYESYTWTNTRFISKQSDINKDSLRKKNLT